MFKLCYISGNCAYFTSGDLLDQWGDDWDDVPYEHNAGEPYTFDWQGVEETVEIKKVYFEVNMETPSDKADGNSKYSVLDINKGSIAWLAPSRFGGNNINFSIMAGESFEGFIEKIKNAGGKVYVEI